MQATWLFRSYVAMKTIADSKLQKMFVFPKYSIVLPDKPIYHDLKLENLIGKVTYTNKRPMHCQFHADFSKPNPDMEFEWIWYGTAKGGSAVNLGPSFTTDPLMVAQQTAFWLPIEYWCIFSEKYKDFSRECTIGFRLQNDNVPLKIKRLWIKNYLVELKKYSKPIK